MNRYLLSAVLLLGTGFTAYAQKFASVQRNGKEIFAFRTTAQDTVYFVNEADTARYNMAALQARGDSLDQRVGQLTNLLLTDEQTLYTGSWVQQKVTATGLSDENAANRVTMHDVIAVPYIGATLHFKTPANWRVGIRHGTRSTNLSTNSYWYDDGGSITLSESDRYYRISIGHYVDDTQLPCPLDSVLQFLRDGRMQFTYTPADSRNTMVRNAACQIYADTLAYTPQDLRILHTSDVHGDAKRFENFCQYADFMGVDMKLVTGDLVAYNSSNGCDFVHTISKKYKTPTFACAGNHDVNGFSTQWQIHKYIIQPFAEAYGYQCAQVGGVMQPYYHYDMDEKKLRVISLNLYDGGHPDNTGTLCAIFKSQINWLIEKLQELLENPRYEGYGVVILMHAPELSVVWQDEYSEFYQKTLKYWQTHKNLNGAPVSLIVNAFIAASRGNSSLAKVSSSYSYTDYQSKTTTVDFTADFTKAVNKDVEFIAYFTGHEHEDIVGYYTTYDGQTNGRYKQFIADVVCNISIDGTSAYPYLTDCCDLPRDAGGSTQDAFNYYVIDRKNKIVKLARIGSNYTTDNRHRRVMTIPYK